MGHFASARRQPRAWTDEDPARITEYGTLWEVICLECGADSGPIDHQPEVIRALRGPYHSADEARAAAIAHSA